MVMAMAAVVVTGMGTAMIVAMLMAMMMLRGTHLRRRVLVVMRPGHCTSLRRQCGDSVPAMPQLSYRSPQAYGRLSEPIA